MKTIVCGFSIMIALMASCVALAAGNSPSASVYDSPAQQVQSAVAGTTTTTSSSGGTQQSQGQLPFTGLDLTFIVVGGGVLLLAGYSLRRVTRKSNPS